MKRLKAILMLVVAMMLMSSATMKAQNKREFRGAWIQCVNGQYLGKSTQQIQAMLTRQLDELQKDGVNAIIFQVRAECDALYKSDLEPWSKFLTGVQGKAPSPYWDPLQWMIEQCHNRGMELHAWINPYRAKHSVTSYEQVSPKNIVKRRPDLCFQYGKLTLLNPGLQAAADYICEVAVDIVSRYDVDGFHIDDYFYPYPEAGRQIPDQQLFRQQSRGMRNIGDWRRDNVSRFVKQLSESIHAVKPWVKFGVSPFGIYRNKKSTADGSGSNTNGLQNYDDLYADITYWVQQGWIDYNIPQIYWEIGHPAADYITLIKWWDKNANGGHLYIGQDVARTMKADQLTRKMRYERALPHVSGNCFWPANEILWNNKGVADSLKRNYHRYPALIPAYTHMHNRPPKDVSKLKTEWTPKGFLLHWQAEQSPTNPELASYFVVYRFNDKEPIDTSDPSKIVAITRETGYLMPYEKGKVKYRYVVTAVDRFHNESEGKTKKVKL